ncbi:LPS translocon maturation chaperone LptM [Bauldia sp.]|uniref:LPS translocon maturation chaperone LptM n=1 Tax=Bauldia sp. TaxID=2575872 RepID=UPI003BABEBBD
MALIDRRMVYRATVAVVLVSAIGLSACGRKGALEPPPRAAVPSDVDPGAPNDDEPDRPFILDKLI